MTGTFDVILTGTEAVNSKDGKTTYFYANLLQGSEVKRARIMDAADYGMIAKVAPLTKLKATLDIAEGFYNGSHFCNFKLIGYTEEEKKQQ